MQIVRVKLFAGARQAAGTEELAVELAEPATVADLRSALLARCPALEPLVRRARFAIDCEFAVDSTPVAPRHDIALIPPVSGG